MAHKLNLKKVDKLKAMTPPEAEKPFITQEDLDNNADLEEEGRIWKSPEEEAARVKKASYKKK